MTNKTKHTGIIRQVALLFLAGIISVGILTYIGQRYHSNITVKRQIELLAGNIADEVTMSVKEYPAHQWLLRYWYTHADELDIEYDVDYAAGTRTEEKCSLLLERHPGLTLKYIQPDELRTWSQDDQKLYAEIVYSWVTTRINQIKASYGVDYLFIVATDISFKTQTFLFSAAAPGSVRGTNYEEVYTLGTKVSVAENEDQQFAMRYAKNYSNHLADAGNYVDYYAYLGEFSNRTVLVGLTYNLSGIRAAVSSQSMRDTILAIIFQICLSGVCLLLLYMFILKPLRMVQQNIRLYKETKDSDTVIRDLGRLNLRNEIGDLADDVKDLAEEIDLYLNRIEKITAEKERIGAELSVASKIQESMLPNIFPAFSDRRDFEIFASMSPAKEVGGDFYDFFMIDDDHLALVMADVSGKGVPAALFMTVSMILIQTSAAALSSPARVLEKVNDVICSNNREEMFVSVWLGILNLKTGKLTAANAGHEYPVLKTPEGHFEIVKKPHGFVVGGMEGIRYKDYELTMAPGSKLFLYTDGLPEATDSDQRLFGMDRMVTALREAEDKAPEKILATVNRHVNIFVGEAQQFDDLTMLCLHYKGE